MTSNEFFLSCNRILIVGYQCGSKLSRNFVLPHYTGIIDSSTFRTFINHHELRDMQVPSKYLEITDIFVFKFNSREDWHLERSPMSYETYENRRALCIRDAVIREGEDVLLSPTETPNTRNTPLSGQFSKEDSPLEISHHEGSKAKPSKVFS